MSAIQVFQQKIGAPGSGTWDPATIAAVRNFQQGHGLPATGDADPATLVKAGVYDPEPRSGSPFMRDLSGAMNQVPRWGWFGVGAVALGLAYASYRSRNPKPKSKRRR